MKLKIILKELVILKDTMIIIGKISSFWQDESIRKDLKENTPSVTLNILHANEGHEEIAQLKQVYISEYNSNHYFVNDF